MDSQEYVALKPCPFCGKPPGITYNNIPFRDHDDIEIWYIFCSNCGTCKQTEGTMKKACDGWNSRVEA